MSKEDIDAAVAEAAKFAEEDKKKKEEVEVKNTAEQTIFQIEKTMGEAGDKITDDEKAPVNAAIEKLRATLTSGSVDDIKADTEALNQSFYKIAEKMYAQTQQGAAGAQPGATHANDDGTVEVNDADFNVEDDNNKK